MLKEKLQELVSKYREQNWPDFVIKNALKEYLQFPVLSFLYSKEKYQNFIFMGGSALRIVHNLPRLSEDLDFNLKLDDYQSLDMNKLGEEISLYFKNDLLLKINYTAREKKAPGPERLYLKFPTLKNLGLSKGGDESDFLYVKIEPQVEDFKNPEYQITPISQFGYNFLVKTYNLKFLMTGKLNAIFERKWFKGDNDEIDIKGRDYYDLYWYLKNNVEPDWQTLNEKFNINNWKDLNKSLKIKIEKEVSAKKLIFDLENFFPEQKFISDFCLNYKNIINPYLENK
jgi:predicted nucleotidyltransferase component of viral defense system